MGNLAHPVQQRLKTIVGDKLFTAVYYFGKFQHFSNAKKRFKTVVYNRLALWTTIFPRNKPKLYK